MVLGLSEDGLHDMTAEEIRESDDVAVALHEVSGWDLPPNPLRLAELAEVKLFELPPTVVEEIILVDQAHYRSVGPGRGQGMWIAHALAGSLLLQRGMDHSRLRSWCLTAQILVPSWICDPWVLEGHPWAPAWLVQLRLPQHLTATV